MSPSSILVAALVIALTQPYCIALSAEPGTAEQSADGASALAPLFLIVQEGKWGLIDATGKVVVEPKYDQLLGVPDENPFFRLLPPKVRAKAVFLDVIHPSVRDQLFPFCQKGRCGAVAPGGAEIIPPRYERTGGLAEGRLAVRRGGLWGFANEVGSEIIPPKFLQACMFHGGAAMVQLAEKRWTLIDVDGRSLVDPPWKEQPTELCELSDEPLTRATQDGHWGFLDRSGHWAVPPRFESVGPKFQDGLVSASLEGRWGFIDPSGQWAVPAKFERVGHHFQNGLVSASLEGRWGFIDPAGKWVIEPRFSDAQEFGCPSDDSAIVKVGDQSGAINRAGVLLFLLPGTIDCTQGPLLRYIKSGLSKDGCLLIGLIDPTGHVVVEPKYGAFDDRYAGMYRAVTCGGVSGKYETVFFDSAGHILTNVTNDLAFKEFHEGFAIYQTPSGKSGFIDETGRVVIEAVYDRAFDFEDGLARVVHGDRVSYVNHAGQAVYSMLFQ